MSIVILENTSLKGHNTFGIEAFARYFVQIESEEQLIELFSIEKFHSLPKLILGGGSNILFTKDYDGLVIFVNIKGISHEVKEHLVQVTAGAGEVWNDLVQYCVTRDFAGIENLSLIPGTAGAAPVQNIGAYGVELKDVFQSCTAFDTQTQSFAVFSREDCKFAYRDSLFKSIEKDRYIITSISLGLSTTPMINTSYGAIEQELKNRAIETPDIRDISEVVSSIRVSKLPDPSTIGNSGSFFKNTIIDIDSFNQLQSKFEEIVHYPVGADNVKIAAGWLIEQCGWKGVKHGNTGTWKNQALVLVNHGGAEGAEVYDFSEKIIASVFTRFGVTLEREVNVL
jgi:UDP-N-acetylmuramate dehydrogenase